MRLSVDNALGERLFIGDSPMETAEWSDELVANLVGIMKQSFEVSTESNQKFQFETC